MKTLCLPADDMGILYGAELLKKGELVAFPTETVYGLGASALDAAAVARIFAAKGRPQDNPLIAHVPGLVEAEEFAHFTPLARDLAAAFWPGPLTLVLRRKPPIPQAVSAGLDTLALRAPSHPVARELIKASGLPIAAPSANRSGRPSPTLAQHVMEDLDGIIPLVLDGGACDLGLESTVVDARGRVPLVLRPGSVTPEMIALVSGSCHTTESVLRPLKEQESAPSPGMRHVHYAPRARMSLVEGSPENCRTLLARLAGGQEKTWVLALDGFLDGLPGVQVISLGKDEQEAARRLFYLLRAADQGGITRIYAKALPRDGLGLAVMNRLARAAGFDIINADLIEKP